MRILRRSLGLCLGIAAEATVSGIDAALELGAKIEGTVFGAASGTPLSSILVCSIIAASGEPWSCSETSLGGAYSLRRLPPGQYKVAFSPELSELFGEEWFEEEDDGFDTQFFDGKTSLATADTLTLASGGLQAGVNAHLVGPVAPPPTVLPPRRGR